MELFGPTDVVGEFQGVLFEGRDIQYDCFEQSLKRNVVWCVVLDWLEWGDECGPN
jgi:hypothetical protein